VLIGTARAGTNLVRSLLNSHAKITVFGELFRHYDRIGWDMSGCCTSESTIQLYHDDPGKFLNDVVFRSAKSKDDLIGFKIFYYHARNDSRSAVWDFLTSQKKIKVLHVMRQNKLAMYFSLRLAHMSGEWTGKTEDRGKKWKLNLAYEDCLKYFLETTAWEKWVQREFRNHQVYNVIYEKLEECPEFEMSKVLQFLRVPIEPLTTTLRKQNQMLLRDCISNYAELKEKFRQTPWEVYFT